MVDEKEISTLIRAMTLSILKQLGDETETKSDDDKNQRFGKEERTNILIKRETDLISKLESLKDEIEGNDIEINDLISSLRGDDLSNAERTRFLDDIESIYREYDYYKGNGNHRLSRSRLEALLSLNVDDYSRKIKLSKRQRYGTDSYDGTTTSKPDFELSDDDQERIEILKSIRGKSEESQKKIDAMIEILRNEHSSKEALSKVYKACDLVSHYLDNQGSEIDSRFVISQMNTIFGINFRMTDSSELGSDTSTSDTTNTDSNANATINTNTNTSTSDSSLSEIAACIMSKRL
ncbi:hypothetical protein [Photobacterium damselae]|uniref:hypothetical protein n=1 Tax=Photobacterium damselae TaxID=38293 RepID=UPI00370B9CD4